MRAAVLLLIAIPLLVACATAPFDQGDAVSGLVKFYSPEFLAQAADELETLPEGSALAVMIADYAVLREQLRAAN